MVGRVNLSQVELGPSNHDHPICSGSGREATPADRRVDHDHAAVFVVRPTRTLHPLGKERARDFAHASAVSPRSGRQAIDGRALARQG